MKSTKCPGLQDSQAWGPLSCPQQVAMRDLRGTDETHWAAAEQCTEHLLCPLLWKEGRAHARGKGGPTLARYSKNKCSASEQLGGGRGNGCVAGTAETSRAGHREPGAEAHGEGKEAHESKTATARSCQVPGHISRELPRLPQHAPEKKARAALALEKRAGSGSGSSRALPRVTERRGGTPGCPHRQSGCRAPRIRQTCAWALTRDKSANVARAPTCPCTMAFSRASTACRASGGRSGCSKSETAFQSASTACCPEKKGRWSACRPLHLRAVPQAKDRAEPAPLKPTSHVPITAHSDQAPSFLTGPFDQATGLGRVRAGRPGAVLTAPRDQQGAP